jgi:hypothetical protein
MTYDTLRFAYVMPRGQLNALTAGQRPGSKDVSPENA